MEGGTWRLQNVHQQDAQQGNSFAFQILRRSLQETLHSFRMSVDKDMRNLLIEMLRQFHMQEMEMSNLMNKLGLTRKKTARAAAPAIGLSSG
ncbi:flocculation protein FLO11-like [Pyrus ussuriensis x Pyrus communis]|uniref:Flocculation protein FLO11-like n=1 Tax=Pyrus ussuriensis x Pyrus communis TaxID=2448454 RepID=A0A5N5HSL1_9ROSA|nr:flocculation protein FLO11-like [Pyrus ussuriensis x Pyrus communis]